MSGKTKRAYCSHCQKHVLAQGNKPNHILHLLLTVFSFGFWAPIWLLLTIMSAGNYRCTQCGSPA